MSISPEQFREASEAAADCLKIVEFLAFQGEVCASEPDGRNVPAERAAWKKMEILQQRWKVARALRDLDDQLAAVSEGAIEWPQIAVDLPTIMPGCSIRVDGSWRSAHAAAIDLANKALHCLPGSHKSFAMRQNAVAQLQRRIRDERSMMFSPQGSAEASRSNAPKGVNSRMLELLQQDESCKGWTAQQFADAIGCKRQSVSTTPTWIELQSHRDNLQSDHANDRRHRPKSSDQRKRLQQE